MIIDYDSEGGECAKAFLFPPFVGAMSSDGEFRRGFPIPVDAPRQLDAGGSRADVCSFHGEGDSGG